MKKIYNCYNLGQIVCGMSSVDVQEKKASSIVLFLQHLQKLMDLIHQHQISTNWFSGDERYIFYENRLVAREKMLLIISLLLEKISISRVNFLDTTRRYLKCTN